MANTADEDEDLDEYEDEDREAEDEEEDWEDEDWEDEDWDTEDEYYDEDEDLSDIDSLDDVEFYDDYSNLGFGYDADIGAIMDEFGLDEEMLAEYMGLDPDMLYGDQETLQDFLDSYGIEQDELEEYLERIENSGVGVKAAAAKKTIPAGGVILALFIFFLGAAVRCIKYGSEI